MWTCGCTDLRTVQQIFCGPHVRTRSAKYPPCTYLLLLSCYAGLLCETKFCAKCYGRRRRLSTTMMTTGPYKTHIGAHRHISAYRDAWWSATATSYGNPRRWKIRLNKLKLLKLGVILYKLNSSVRSALKKRQCVNVLMCADAGFIWSVMTTTQRRLSYLRLQRDNALRRGRVIQ